MYLSWAISILELMHGMPMSEQSLERMRIHVDQSLLQVGARTNSHAFGHYKARFNRSYETDSTEHQMREEIFNRRLVEIQLHNERMPLPSWRAGLNHLTDRTDDELLRMRGYRRQVSQRLPLADEPVSLLGKTCLTQAQKCSGPAGGSCCTGLLCGAKGTCEKAKQLPESIDWSVGQQAGEHVMNQGECGSCWAIAAQGAVEMQASFLSNRSLSLSAQGMLGCTPNPHECGGSGGCGGATPELALQWASENGIVPTSSLPYTAESACSKHTFKPQVRIGGYVQLKENRARELLQSLATVGPLAAAVDASQWSLYMSGVFDHCAKEPVVDHAILLVGYGQDGRVPYWRIRNSWGADFGEQGFLRLRRHAPHGEEPCGWDYDPQKGNGCKGGPSKIWVCGECGVLSDVVYPVGTKVLDMS